MVTSKHEGSVAALGTVPLAKSSLSENQELEQLVVVHTCAEHLVGVHLVQMNTRPGLLADTLNQLIPTDATCVAGSLEEWPNSSITKLARYLSRNTTDPPQSLSSPPTPPLFSPQSKQVFSMGTRFNNSSWRSTACNCAHCPQELAERASLREARWIASQC